MSEDLSTEERVEQLKLKKLIRLIAEVMVDDTFKQANLKYDKDSEDKSTAPSAKKV